MKTMLGSPPVSKRQLLLGMVTSTVLLSTASVSFAQQSLDFDTVMAKEGGYAGIIKEFLGTTDPKIIAFVKREGDRYIASLATDQKKRGIEKLDAELSSLLSKAKGQRAAGSTVEFFSTNAPQLLVEFIPYEKEYPNIAELGRWVQSKVRSDEAQRRGDEAQRRAREEEEFGRRLRQLNGQRP